VGLSDFEKVEAKFDKDRSRARNELVALIDKRLAVLRKVVPGAEYNDAMGSQSLSDKNADQREDGLYKATDNVLERHAPQTEETYGEPLPEYLVMAKLLTEEYADVIREIFEIGTHLTDVVGGTYS
jgi:hypothetical protein